MTNDELRSLLDSEIRGAIGYDTSELSAQRKQALEYYYGEPFGNEEEGRSSYVSRDVADTIEWVMPSLMRIFTGGDTIVRFEPQGPEDEAAANQATDYINYIFQRQNDGFLTLYTWFKDALLSKNGFVKVYWEKTESYKTETYNDLSDDEFSYIMAQEGVEAIEHEEEVEETGLKVHSVKIRVKKNDGKCTVIPVPPEEILVSKNPVAPLTRNRFICHRRKVTVSELKEMGYENVDDLGSYEDDDFNTERTARFSFDETNQAAPADDTPGNKSIWLAECYVKIDFDGDGVAELRKVTLAGNRVLDNEECDSIPFVTITPIIIPHKLYGMSVADLVMDLQLLKSTVFRQILDNMYLANNGRYMALDGMVNIDDLLTSRPGGIVRVKTFDAVKPMQPPLLGAPAFNMLEYLDVIKENRTGVTRYNQGLDSNSLNKTATGINQIMSAAQGRIELIARVFAETGVKDLFYAILEVVQKHQDKQQIIRLQNQWVPIDPREWTNKFDMSVSVGLGTGSKESQLAALNEETQFQMAALQAGLPIVTPVNLYQLRMKALEAKNIKGGDLFYTHPDQMPPAPPQVDPALEKAKLDAQVKTQLQDMKHQSAMEKQAMRQQHDAEKTLFSAQQEIQKMGAEMQHETSQNYLQAMVEKMKADQVRALETQRMQLDAIMKKAGMVQDTEESEKDRYFEAIQAQNDRQERLLTALAENMAKMAEAQNRPKKVVRDAKNRVVGVE